MSERGARLQSASEASPRSATERFTVDVEVRSATNERGYAARMSISSESGAHDVRQVKAARCGELHSAVAWVLVVLAQGPRILDENRRESDAKTKPASGFSGSAPAVATLNAPDPPAVGARPIPPSPTADLSRTLVLHGRVTLREKTRFAVGAQLIGGWLYLRDPAWGPAVFFEHRPLRGRPWAWRLSLLTLANDTSATDADVQITARRTAVGLGGSVAIPRLPLRVTSGFEAGILSARGSGALLSQQSQRPWAAWLVGVALEVPVFRDRLWFGAGVDAAICPFTYAFQTNSERTIVESRPVELRGAAGFNSRF